LGQLFSASASSLLIIVSITLHYRGDGVFMLAGGAINLRKNFKRQNL